MRCKLTVSCDTGERTRSTLLDKTLRTGEGWVGVAGRETFHLKWKAGKHINI